MPRSDNPRAVYESERDRLERAAGDAITDADAEAIMRFVDAHDGQNLRVTVDGVKDKAARTLKRYTATLRLTARRLDHYDTTLLDADSDTINRFMEDLHKGNHPDVPADGLATNSVSNKQGTVRKFCRFTDDAIADAEAIGMYGREDTKVDERDVLDRDEIEACRDVVVPQRDRAMFELMLFTGQRVRAVQTLRVRDVDLDQGPTGTFWLNEDAAGLKGADGKRPLLGAHEAVRDYLRNDHPCPDDPDAALFTCLPGYSPKIEYGEQLHHTAIGRAIKKIGQKAGVERLHPHLLRHTAVTTMHRRYDIDESHIKYIIGHDQDSTVMETTYSHLSAEDHIHAVEVAGGYRDPDDEETLTPGNCPKCDARLDPSDAACSRCGMVFTPDAHAAQEQLDDAMYEGQRDAQDDAEAVAVDKLRETIQQNPELRALLLEEHAGE